MYIYCSCFTAVYFVHTVHCFVNTVQYTVAVYKPLLLCHFTSVPTGGIVTRFDCTRLKNQGKVSYTDLPCSSAACYNW